MESRVKILGHPVHPTLIAFPLGLFAAAVVFDILFMTTGNRTLPTVSYYKLSQKYDVAFPQDAFPPHHARFCSPWALHSNSGSPIQRQRGFLYFGTGQTIPWILIIGSRWGWSESRAIPQRRLDKEAARPPGERHKRRNLPCEQGKERKGALQYENQYRMTIGWL